MNREGGSRYGQLEKQIIAVLSEGHSLSSIELQGKIERNSGRYSIQAIYHVLRKLRRQGVVLKVKNKFSVSITWALDLLDLAKHIEHRVLSALPAIQVVPPPNQTLSWSFSNLISLDDFWVQLMLILFRRSNVGEMFNFSPHPWFYYAHQTHLEKFYRVLSRRKSKICLVNGGNCYLDLQFIAAMSPELYHCVQASGEKVGGRSGRHIMVIGEYIIVVSLKAKMAIGLERCFSAIRSSKLGEIQQLQSQINQPTRASLKVTHNKKLALNLKERFLEICRENGRPFIKNPLHSAN